jgi:hypothetical protein
VRSAVWFSLESSLRPAIGRALPDRFHLDRQSHSEVVSFNAALDDFKLGFLAFPQM